MNVSPHSGQTDDALRLLAGLFARRFAHGTPSSSQSHNLAAWHASERLRDLFMQAETQPEALVLLAELAEQVEEEWQHDEAAVALWKTTVGEARTLLIQVSTTGGSAQVLLAGETDGFRHLCRRCSQDDANFQRLLFFNHSMRRPLLKAEVCRPLSSGYARCRVCLQVLVPTGAVVLIPMGTTKHQPSCGCHDCNKRSVATLLHLYACDEVSCAVRLPRAAQIAAPSRQQARERAFLVCQQQGWYVLGDAPSA